MDVSIYPDIGDNSQRSKYDHSIPMITFNNDPFFESKGNRVRRLFAIGDVHGTIDEFNALISSINYNHKKGDRLILLGDLVNKGPDSVGIIRRAKQLKAWCVRGNHDDITLRMYAYLKENNIPFSIESNATIPEGPVVDPIKLSDDHIQIVRNMTEEDYLFLNSCPTILGIPSLNSLFVHAGVDPRKPLENQVPYLVKNMRSILPDGTPTSNRTNINWANEWNQFEEAGDLAVEKPYTDVYYGHDSRLGLQLKSHTFGLDTACVFGGQLTALELKTRNINQVVCKKYADYAAGT
ncbi:Metallo-dependent phosphatase-like protein [Phascolomyces articulosus]|uniref:Metallo-dependent phosphatase-like protein n=1 Tax=Phascolomyces articulosus TaxID=60185 RepID=A0AAD5KL74_9FUNG|nr:Metallo-dependent phosphatase-like protein [Phascolomyces articulosus]